MVLRVLCNHRVLARHPSCWLRSLQPHLHNTSRCLEMQLHLVARKEVNSNYLPAREIQTLRLADCFQGRAGVDETNPTIAESKKIALP